MTPETSTINKDPLAWAKGQRKQSKWLKEEFPKHNLNLNADILPLGHVLDTMRNDDYGCFVMKKSFGTYDPESASFSKEQIKERMMG